MNKCSLWNILIVIILDCSEILLEMVVYVINEDLEISNW